MKACNLYSSLSYEEVPTLFIEFHGSETEVEAQIETMKGLVEDNKGGEFQWAIKQEDRNKLWTARHKYAP